MFRKDIAMCGIVGFTSNDTNAAPILLDGLSRLEYRGYDSAGLAIRNGDEEPKIVKAKGRLKLLVEKTDGGAAVEGTTGIGHTRWATHGELLPSRCQQRRALLSRFHRDIQNRHIPLSFSQS